MLTKALKDLQIPDPDRSSVSIQPDEEQKAFEEKMDMYLLGA